VPVVGQAALWGTGRGEEGDDGLKVTQGVVGDGAPLGIAWAQPKPQNKATGQEGRVVAVLVQHCSIAMRRNLGLPIVEKVKSEFLLRIEYLWREDVAFVLIRHTGAT